MKRKLILRGGDQSSDAVQVEGRTGEYWVDSKPSKSNAASQDEAAAKRLWDISLELTGAEFKFPT